MKKIINYNIKGKYQKNQFQKYYKSQNTIYYTNPNKVLLSSFNQSNLRNIFNIEKEKESIKKITNKKTPERTNEYNSKKLKKLKLSKFLSLNMTISDNNDSNLIKKINKNTNNSVLSNKKSFFNINPVNFSKNNIFQEFLDRNNLFKKMKIQKNNVDIKNPLKNQFYPEENTIKLQQRKKIFIKCKNKLNNYSKSFLYSINYNRKEDSRTYKRNKIIERSNIVNSTKKNNNIKNKKNLADYSLKNVLSKNNSMQINNIIKKHNKKNDIIRNKISNIHKFKTYISNLQNKSILNADNSYTFSKINKKLKENKMDMKKKMRLNRYRYINNNISSKPTNFSSIITSEKNARSSKKSKKDIVDPKNKNENKRKFLFEFLINPELESNNTTQEYESKFLNYELGIPDEFSSLNNIDKKKNENKENKERNENEKIEYEKPVEEMEKIAYQIIHNSNYKYKKISFFNHESLNTKNRKNKDNIINNDINEFKDGEQIQNVLTLFVSRDNKK